MKKLEKNKFLTITLPLFLWAATIMVLTSIPGEKMPEIGVWNWDKLAHGAVYLILAFLLFRYLILVRAFTIANAWKLGMVIGIIYAGIDELHQMPIPNRLGTWQDFLADSLGVGIGLYIAVRYFRRKMNKV
jgi:VanZ family protein